MALARSSTESLRFSLERRRKRRSMIPATRNFKRAKTAKAHARGALGARDKVERNGKDDVGGYDKGNTIR